MPIITYGGQSYQCPEQVSVLDCLTAHGVTIPSSCHAGLCQTCLMQAVKGKVPSSAQAGIKKARLLRRIIFLPATVTLKKTSW